MNNRVSKELLNSIPGYENRMVYETPFIKQPKGTMVESDSENLKEQVKRTKVVESIKIAMDAGVKKENIILDPGIGFAKTYEENLIVMKNVKEIRDMGYPVLLGTSRKSMIGNTLNLPVDQRVEGTLVTTVMGIMSGCEFISISWIKYF